MPPDRRRIYVLTQDGQIKGATYSSATADRWLSLGEMYDYVGLEPDQIGGADAPAPESTREQPSKAMERTQQITEDADKLRKNLETQTRKFQPKSPLLKDQD
jgi:hypothetical protein